MAAKIQIHKMWTKYVPDPNDPAKLVGEDWVLVGPPGMGDRTQTPLRMKAIQSVRPRDPNLRNKMLDDANDLREAIEPAYLAWKKGQDMPDSGTPLAAWNAITPELADILKARSIRTVEDIAELTETSMQRVPTPGIRRLRDQAKLFLQAKDQTRVASDLAKKDEEIAALKAQMAEVMEALKANDKTGQLEPLAAPKRRGRPPKVQEPEEAAA